MAGTPASTVAAASEARRVALCAREHDRCFACRPGRAGGLGLQFHVHPDGGVAAEWPVPPGYESYAGILHGGLVATALDSAMVQALFAHDVVGRTGELTVRYRQPVVPDRRILLRAWLRRAAPPLFQLEAEARQEGRLCAQARAKFMAG